MRRRYRTGDQALVREINLSTVLSYLQENIPLSRAQLANLIGLNKTTVSSLVEELLDRGLVHQVGQDTSGGGRPATLLDLAPQAGCIIGLALGVDFISAVLTDFAGQVRWRHLQETDPTESQDAIITQTLRLVDKALAANQSCGARLLGLGLATPGTVNVEEGVLIFSPNLQWRNVPFRQIFHEHAGLPVFVDNDANAGAVAEHLFGVAQQAQDFIFIFAGVGVGGGLFLKGELYRGTGGFAGEIGHTNFMLEPYRAPCRCGNRGCWETYTNQYSIVERVRARLAVRRNSLIPQLMAEQHSPLTVPIILQAAEANDAEAMEALTEAGSAMGLGIANLVNIFNPEMVILGGTLSAAGKYLLPAIKEAVEKTALPEIRQQVQILLSAFGPDASVMGAAALVIEAILSNPSSVDRLSRRSHLQRSMGG
jgi:glucokinase-like ROK family protein